MIKETVEMKNLPPQNAFEIRKHGVLLAFFDMEGNYHVLEPNKLQAIRTLNEWVTDLAARATRNNPPPEPPNTHPNFPNLIFPKI